MIVVVDPDKLQADGHRMCPRCQIGVGTARRTVKDHFDETLATRYYKCDSCPQKWKVKVKSEVTIISIHVIRPVD